MQSMRWPAAPLRTSVRSLCAGSDCSTSVARCVGWRCHHPACSAVLSGAGRPAQGRLLRLRFRLGPKLSLTYMQTLTMWFIGWSCLHPSCLAALNGAGRAVQVRPLRQRAAAAPAAWWTCSGLQGPPCLGAPPWCVGLAALMTQQLCRLSSASAAHLSKQKHRQQGTCTAFGSGPQRCSCHCA